MSGPRIHVDPSTFEPWRIQALTHDLGSHPLLQLDSLIELGKRQQGRKVFAKGGSLDSDPVTRVEAGWREGPEGAVVHVVMLAQDGVDAAGRADAGQRLGDAARRIQELLLAPR